MKGRLGAENRIAYLDGLRGLAILAVLGFHYFSRFADGRQITYPYGNGVSEFFLFEYGYYGVQLFFAISGFVIGLTLDRCSGPLEFAVRRFARLWPTMLLCSVLTYTVLTIWPAYWPQSAANFLPSLTFVDSVVWNRLIPGLDSDWIDGAYWSLFVEVQFYILAAIIYYFSHSRFALVFTIFSVVTVIAYLGVVGVREEPWLDMLKALLIPVYLPWFLIGIAALSHHRGRFRESISIVTTAIGLLMLFAVLHEAMSDLIVGVFVAVLLFAPLHSRRLVALLGQSWLVAVGIASYSLYLLHQNAGLTLILVVSAREGITGTVALVLPLLVGVGLVVISRVIYRYWETPLNKLLVRFYSGIGASTSQNAA